MEDNENESSKGRQRNKILLSSQYIVVKLTEVDFTDPENTTL